MSIVKILNGHRSFETAYEVKDYPYGFRLRCIIRYWIETKKKFGDRMVSQTLNPKTEKWNAPKPGQYSTFKFMYLDENGHVQCDSIDAYHVEQFPERLKFLIEEVKEATDDQVFHLRHDYYTHMKMSYPYDAVKYDDESKPAYAAWMKTTLTHISTAELHELTNFPPPPVQTNPGGEVKMTIKEYNG